MRKDPSFQFYPGDWIKDPELRCCSLSARGAWIDIIVIMSQCKPMGLLATDGIPWDDDRLARAIGGACDTSVTDAILELKNNGVLKKNKSGFYYSKRLLEIADERNKWKKRQKKHRCKQPFQSPECHADVTPMSRPSSSSSSSSSSKKEIHTHASVIFDHWNACKIILHKDIKNSKPAINAKLEHYSVEELKEAITNYKTIIESDEYFFKYRWTLKDFLQRGLEKFLTINDPFSNYRVDMTPDQRKQRELEEKFIREGRI